MNQIVTLNHGAGGRITHDLISGMFKKHFNNEYLDKLTDATVLPTEGEFIAFTTDGYVVDPIFFPGGNIGKLAVCGTVNDLAVSGADPKYLSASFILEEGFSLLELETIVKSMAEESKNAGISIVTGDTKVVHKGKGDKIFITTSGVGFVKTENKHISEGIQVKPGYKLLVNGSMGDHAIAILASRESLTFETPIQSDCASLNKLIFNLLENCPSVAFMRDATRGGLATVACELASKTGFEIILDEAAIPVQDSVQAICEVFGFDPLFLANEGKVLIAVAPQDADKALALLQSHELGKNAAIIGEVTELKTSRVILKTFTGGKRWVDMPSGTQLPRIC